MVVKAFHQLLVATNPDKLIGKLVIPTHWVLNSVLFFGVQAVMMSASTHVLQTTDTVIADNDKNIDSLISQGLTGVISQCLFDQSHFAEAGGRPWAHPPTRSRPSTPRRQPWRRRRLAPSAHGRHLQCDALRV